MKILGWKPYIQVTLELKRDPENQKEKKKNNAELF